MTTQEAIAEISRAKAEGREIELQDAEQHRWAIGVNRLGEFFWTFRCGCFDIECDDCEYDTYKTVIQLVSEHCLASSDWKWDICEPANKPAPP